MKSLSCRIGFVATALVSASVASAQYSSGFEDIFGDADGIDLTGQDGYYLPVTGSTDFEVYTYAANSLRIPPNPTGNTQFIAGLGQGNSTFERAQRDLAMASGVWTASTDILATFVGFGASAQNIGSFSLNRAGSFQMIQLARWVNPATPTSWNADYIWFDAAGAQLTESVPDANFQNLSTDHWYRWGTTIDLDANQILAVSLTDIMTGDVFVYNPTDRYLTGGAGGGGGLDAFRFFAGGSVAGNVLAFDNPSLELVPAPGALALLGLGGLAAIRRRR
jgi:hypothetical protein